MEIVRVLLIVALGFVMLLYVSLSLGIYDDLRLAEAIAHNAMNSTEATRRELAEAIAANHRFFIIEQAAFPMTIVCFSFGIVLTTKRIRMRRHPNQALELTASSIALSV